MVEVLVAQNVTLDQVFSIERDCRDLLKRDFYRSPYLTNTVTEKTKQSTYKWGKWICNSWPLLSICWRWNTKASRLLALMLKLRWMNYCDSRETTEIFLNQAHTSNWHPTVCRLHGRGLWEQSSTWARSCKWQHKTIQCNVRSVEWA